VVSLKYAQCQSNEETLQVVSEVKQYRKERSHVNSDIESEALIVPSKQERRQYQVA
jgi:hypothetical protein